MTKRALSALMSGLMVLNLVPIGGWTADPFDGQGQRAASTLAWDDAPRPVGLGQRIMVGPWVAKRPTPQVSRPASPKIWMRWTTGGSRVALTFDDGPHPVWTPQVLDRLRAAGVKATFCLVGTEAARYPALVRRIVQEGHTLCNHSWGHDLKLGVRPESVIRADLLRTSQAIRRAVPGVRIGYFRQPGGRWTPRVAKVARQLGMVSLSWTVDPRDWERPGAAVISWRTVARARAGAIILLHDGGGDRSGTLRACPYVLVQLQRRFGFTLLR